MVNAPSYANLLWLPDEFSHDQITDIKSIWSYWKNALTANIDVFVPKRKPKKFLSPPWIDGEAIHTIRKKNFTRKKARCNNSDWQKYRQMRRDVKYCTWYPLRELPTWRTYLTTHLHSPNDFGTLLTNWPIVLPFLIQSPLTTKYSLHLIPRLKLSTTILPQSSTHVQSFLQISKPHYTCIIISVISSWIKKKSVMFYWS